MAESEFTQRLRAIGRDSARRGVGADTPTQKAPSPYDTSFRQDYVTGIGPNEQQELDRQRLGPAEYAAKYGAAAQQERLVPGLTGFDDPVANALAKATKRTVVEGTVDNAIGFGSGVVQGTGGLVNLGLRIADQQQKQNKRLLSIIGAEDLLPEGPDVRETMRSVSDVADKISGFMKKGQTDLIRTKLGVAQKEGVAKFADTQLEFDNSAQDTAAWLKKIGKDAFIEGERLLTNPDAAVDIIAEATGSLVPSLIGSGGISAAARGVLSKTALKQTAPKLAAGIERAVTATSVGVMEGQGAYDQTVSEVGQMTEQALTEGSEDYRTLRTEGMSHEEAQLTIGDRAGVRAQLLQTAIATAIAVPFTKFEGNPLRRVTMNENTKDILGQTVEEALQGSTGQVSGNLGIQRFADTNKDTTEGVGVSFTQGALGGIGATSAITTPTLVGGAFIAASENAGKLSKHVIEVRAGEARKKQDDQSPVGEKATTENIAAFDDILTQASEIIKNQEIIATADEGPVPENVTAEMAALVDSVKDVPVQFSDTTSEEFTARTAAFKDDVVQNSRIGTLRRVAAKLNKDAYSDPATAKAAAEFVLEELPAVKEFISDIAEKAEGDVSPTASAAQVLVSKAISNKVMSTGFDKATEVLNAQGGDTAVSTKEAVLNPVGVSSARVANTDRTNLGPVQNKIMNVVQAIQAPETHALGETSPVVPKASKTRDTTRDELLFSAKNMAYKSLPSFNSLVSDALQGAIKAARSNGATEFIGADGVLVDSLDSFARITALVQHQLNKYEAATESLAYSKQNPGRNSERNFAALNQDGAVDAEGNLQFDSVGKIYVNAGSESSLETYELIRQDTNTGIRLHNALVEQFPEIYKGGKFNLIPDPKTLEDTSNAEVKKDEQANQSAEDQSTSPETVAVDARTSPAADSDARPDPVRSNLTEDELDTDAFFEGGDETTFEKAIAHLESQTNLTPIQKAVLELIKTSGFAKDNYDTKVRRGGPDEKKPTKNTRGWWDPVKKEVVIFKPSISAALHEMFHAASLEKLNQNLFTAYNKKSLLNNQEKAAVRLLKMSNAFIDSRPTDKKTAAIQAMMRKLIKDDKKNKGTRGQVLAVNEFMAYGLTEKTMSQQLGKTRYERPTLAGQILDMIKALFGLRRSSNVLNNLFIETSRLLAEFEEALAEETEAKAEAQTETVESDEKGETAPDSRNPSDVDPVEIKSEKPIEPAVTPEPVSVNESVQEKAVPVVAEKAATPAPVVTTAPTEKAPVKAAEPVQEKTTKPTEPATQETYVIGSNLAKDADGKVALLEAYTFDPILKPGDEIMDKVLEYTKDGDYLVDESTQLIIEDLLIEMEKMSVGMNKRLNQKGREKKYGDENFLTKVRKLQTGETDTNLVYARDGKILAFLDSAELVDSVAVYDDHLLRLALMATMDYVMNTESGGGVYKDKDILKALGLGKEAKRNLTKEMFQIVNFGRNGTDTKEALARHIMAFWGATPNNKVSRTYSKGFADAMADEIMDYLQDTGTEKDFWMQKQTLWFKDGAKAVFAVDEEVLIKKSGKVVDSTFNKYTSYKLGTKGEELGAAKTIFRDMLTDKNADVHQYRLGESFTDAETADTLKKDKTVAIPEPKRNAMKKMQDTAFTLSKGMLDIYQAFGVDALAEILGFENMSDPDLFYNDNHRESVKGKNASVNISLKEVATQLDKIHAYAIAHNMNPEDVAIHYPLTISLNGRFFMKGFNPASNKLARDMFTASNSTISMDTKKADLKVFWAAVGQAMDESSLKVENLGLEASGATAKELIDTKYRAAVDAIAARHDKLKVDNHKAIVAALAGKDIESTPRLLKALFAVAQYEAALAQREASFQTDLVMELDGKTNGPITAAIQNSLDEFSPEFLALVRRGGFFIGSRNMTHSDYADFQKEGRKRKDNNKDDNYGSDLYLATGQVMSSKIVEFNRRIKKGLLTVDGLTRPKTIASANKAQTLMLELLTEMGDITFTKAQTSTDENGNVTNHPASIVVKRSGTKSPITQNLYGAGANSIAAGLTRAIFKVAYEEMSYAVRNGTGDKVVRMGELIDELADINVGVDFDTQQIYAYEKSLGSSRSLITAIANKSKGSEAWKEGLARFSFSDAQFKRISDSIATLYVPAFKEALSETVGESVERVNTTLKDSATVAANIYLAVIQRALDDMVKLQRKPLDKRTEAELAITKTYLRPGTELSVADFNSIVSQHQKFAPIVDTGDTTFNLSGGKEETSSQVRKRRDEQIEDQKKNPDIVVEATFLHHSETLSGTYSASKRNTFADAGVKILPYNVIANADVAMLVKIYNHVSMSLNTLPVHDGIEVALGELESVSKIMNEAISETWMTNTIEPVAQSLRNLYELRKELLALGIDEFTLEALAIHIAELETMSIERQARIDALKTVQYTVDGGPGAQAPFVQEKGMSFDNEADLIKWLEAERKRNIAKATKAVERSNSKSKTYLDDIEIENPEGSPLRAALEAVNFNGDIKVFMSMLAEQVTNPDQQLVLSEIAKSPAMQMILESGMKVAVMPTGGEGHLNAFTRTIHISNLVPETALHEVVHAATIFQIEEHYLDPEGDTNIDRVKAIARLESLMDDFLSRSFQSNTVEAHLSSTMSNLIAENSVEGRIRALHEFMAWSLSNERLIARGKSRVATDSLSQVQNLGKKVIQAMRRLLGFSSNKVFDHVLFNTIILLNTGSGNTATSTSILRQNLAQAITPPTADGVRKATLQALITKQVSAYLDGRLRGDNDLAAAARQAQAAAEYSSAELVSMDALSRVNAAGFDVTSTQDQLLFRSLQSMFSVDLQLDKIARLEAQKLFETVSSKLSPESFLQLMGTTGPQATQTQEQQADRMYRAVIGLPFMTDTDPINPQGPSIDSKNLSDRLAVFMALSQTSPVLREALENIDFKSLKLQNDFDTKSLDGVITGMTDRTIGAINKRVIGTQAPNASVALDVLTEMLLSFEAEAAFDIENDTSSFLNKVNAKAKDLLEGSGRTAGDALAAGSLALADPNNTQGSPALKQLGAAVLGIAAYMADMLVKDRAAAKADELTSYLNDPEISESVRNLWGEFRGITDDNRLVFRHVREAKQQVSAARQEYVESVPKIVANQFSDAFREGTKTDTHKTLSKRLAADWAFMFKGFGRTDLALLTDTLGYTYTLGLFGNSPAKKRIRKDAIKDIRAKIIKEAKLLGLTPEQTGRITDAYFDKAKQLAEFQNTWKTGDNLLVSAHAILGLYNEDGYSLTKADALALRKALTVFRDTSGALTPTTALNQLVRSIDTLVSLEAVDRLDAPTHNRLQELVVNETDGVKFALNYMNDLRKQEREKTDQLGPLINGFKGHMNPSARRKYSVIIGNDADYVQLAEQGYVRVRDYDGPLEKITPGMKRGYYFSAHQKLANYNQGAMQTVQDTYNGVDPITSLTVGPETTGAFIKGQRAVILNRKLKQYGSGSGQDNVIPRFSNFGDLIGFEQTLAPDMMERLQLSENFAESLGKWSGRIKEEQAATGLNKGLIDDMYETFKRDSRLGKQDEYAEFGRVRNDQGELVLTEDLEKDQIWRESYFLIPKGIREYAHDRFEGPIMIRRDMINNSLGFRSPSVTDVFTGKSRYSEQFLQTVKDVMIATPFLGPDMYKYLTSAEDLIQNVVSEVKHVIVVKSGVILVANTVSNIIQLAGREVPLSYMAKRTKSKYAEVAQYKENEQLKIKLRAQMTAAISKSAAAAIQNRIETIEESEKRMSIWPLIEANQFTTISEGLTDVDKALIDGKYMDWVEKKAGELPGALSTVARYAIVSKDTALYQGMARAVQYSDFIAKAVYFDFLTQERGLSAEESISKIDAEFINYDLLDSRARTYLESMGLTWFMNFKIRATKIAIDMARNNPASVILSLTTAGMIGLDTGSPINDNIVMTTADGRIAYSVGPEMVKAGWTLNLWNQLFGN